MKKATFALVLCCLFCGFSPKARALMITHIGAKPLSEANYQAHKGIVPLVNHESRVYYIWINGNEHFYYHGDTALLNDALRKFAATEAPVHEVILRPATGLVPRQHEGKPIPFQWSLNIHGGIALHTTRDKATHVWSEHPTLTVYVGGEIKLEEIEIPKGLTVLEISDLSKRCRKGLESADTTVRGWGAGVLARLDPYDVDSMAAIAKLLEDEESWVRRNAAGAMSVFGKKAESAIPALQACLETDDQQLKESVQRAVEKIRQAEDTFTLEAEHRAVARQISQFCDAL